MSTIKVSKVEPVTTGGDCIVSATNIVGNKNLVINGAMEIAQRATSSTTSGYATVDRFKHQHGGADEAPTYAQVSLTSSDTGPWAKGFRKAFQITNGNQTSGAGAADYIQVKQSIEAQDLASSGWDYTSGSNYITLSFWVKSSVAQTMFVRFLTPDNDKAFSFSISATTSWQRIIQKIPGAAGVQFDSNNGVGGSLFFIPFYGTDYTTSGHTNDSWIADSGSDQVTDMTSTWWTTNDATFSLTGVQLEVGDIATAYEHRSYGNELLRCQRYYYKSEKYGTSSGSGNSAVGVNYTGYQTSANAWIWVSVPFPVTMRAAPTVDTSDQAGNTGNKHSIYTSTGGGKTDNISNYHTTSFKDHFTCSNYSEQKYGMQVAGFTADAEL